MAAELAAHARAKGGLPPDDEPAAWLAPRWIVGVALSVAVLLTAAAMWFAFYEREEQRSQSVRRAALYARVLTDQVDRSFDTVQVTLRTLADSVTQSDLDDNVTQRMTQALRSVSFLRSLHVIDQDGRVLASTNPALKGWTLPQALLGEAPGAGRWRLPGVLAGRDLKDAQQVGAEVPKRLVVPVVLAVQSADDGRTVLRWVGVVNPDHFSTHFDLLLKDTGLRAALLQLDLRVVAASEQMPVPVGLQPLQAAALAEAWRAKAFDQRMGVGVSGEESALAYRNSRLAPWLVAVEEPLQQTDEAFRTLAAETLAAWLLALGVVLVVTRLALNSARSHERQQLARAAARRELARQHVLTANLIDASATALYAKDGQGRLLMANQAWGRMAGCDRAPLIGQLLPDSLQWADPASPDCPDHTLQAQGDVVTFEVQLASPIGPRDMLVSKVAVKDEAGEAVALVGSLTDISVYREAERRSLEAAEAARQANDAKSEFVANISHELRTPLQSILGFSEIGMVRCTDSPAAQGYFKRVHDAGKHMLSLVEDLLDLAKPELHAELMSLEVHVLGALVGEVLDELSAQASAKTIRIAQHGLAQVLASNVEKRGFQQVVRNLLANAIRFAPEGSQIDVALVESTPGQLRLSVSDRGPGIPAAELEAVFAPFVQSSLTKTQAGGTGLGLAICRRLVQAFGGRVWAEARLGGGAVFMVELPRA